MFSNLRQSSPFDGILIDDRNERPLTVALATILVLWSLAFALTFASARWARTPYLGLAPHRRSFRRRANDGLIPEVIAADRGEPSRAFRWR